MSGDFEIRREPATAMHAAQECTVAREAAKARPGSAVLRLRLATLLNQLDGFDETIALLGAVAEGELGHAEAMLLSHAHFSRDAPGDAEGALAAARSAHAAATSDHQRASAYADQARALFRLERANEACNLLRSALRSAPGHEEACKRLVNYLLRTGDAGAALGVTDALADKGIDHIQLTALRALTLARTGRRDEARGLLGLDRFVSQGAIAAPGGWESLSAFNAALAAEISAHPALRFERHGTASVKSWRLDSLVAGGARLAAALLDRIVPEIERQVAALATSDHPWVGARPRAAMLRSWCVITEGPGYEAWHMHPSGWLSGVYYVAVPEEISGGDGKNGCLILGVPEGVPSSEHAAAMEECVIRPRPGLIATFPSHAYHRTFPHGAAGKRICVAFDVVPTA